MSEITSCCGIVNPKSALDSPSFELDAQVPVNHTVSAASISPCGRDIALASREGLHILDLDNLHAPPRHLVHRSPWEVADVQWSPFSNRSQWVVSTSNQKALVWNLDIQSNKAPIQFILHAHSRAITDIHFSAHHPDLLSTCSVDSYIHCWDLRAPIKPVFSCADWNAGASQVKWNRQESHLLASTHDRFLHIWDDRNGTSPLISVEAHDAKINGLDWSRVSASQLITSSLDQTVKVWDFNRAAGTVKPVRVIETDYPVRRARHTPFGHGAVAMPQRGPAQLELFDLDLKPGQARVGKMAAEATFRGHDNNIQEFLWRQRGGIEDGADMRDFQLISLGTDHRLFLHKVAASQLAKVGFTKGEPAQATLKFTRSGAEYKTYRVISTGNQLVSSSPSLPNVSPCAGTGPGQKGGAGAGAGGSSSAMSRKIQELVGSRSHGTGLPSLSFSPSDVLREEVERVQALFPDVVFHKIKITARKRSLTCSLLCRWGKTHKADSAKMKIRFPLAYPRIKAPEFEFKKLPSAMSSSASVKLHRDLDTIAEHYRCRRVGSLEAAIGFLLGRTTLKESIGGFRPKLGQIESIYEDGNCSDGDFDTTGKAAHHRQAKAKQTPAIDPPPARMSGSAWTPDGRLFCFFSHTPNMRAWEPHGRAEAQVSLAELLREEEDEESESDESTCSSTGSSDLEELAHVDTNFFLMSPWHNDGRHPYAGAAGAGKGKQHQQMKGRARNLSTLAVYSFPGLLPGSRELARDYVVLGSSDTVCKHNAKVALKHGFVDIAASWKLADLVIQTQIPLEWMYMSEYLSSAELASLSIRPSVEGTGGGSSGGSSEFVGMSSMVPFGRLSLEGHLLSRPWVVDQMFDHFERLADIQTLAMLSMIFLLANYKNQQVPRAGLECDGDGAAVAAGGGGYPHSATSNSVCSTSLRRSAPVPGLDLAGVGAGAGSGSGSGRTVAGRDTPSATVTPRGPSVSNSQAGTPSSVVAASPVPPGRPSVRSAVAAAALPSTGVTWGSVQVFGEPGGGGGGGGGGGSRKEASGWRAQGDAGGSRRDADADGCGDGGRGTATEIRVTTKNRDRFDSGGFFGTSMLDARLVARAHVYHAMYGYMLAAWGISG